MQYSDAFVDWLVDKIGQDKKFFAKVRARDLARRRASV
jgi:hypothetical protein